MRVLIVGPDVNVQGGISHVIRLMLKYPPEGVEYQLHPTITQAVAAAHIPRRHPAYYRKAAHNLLFFLKSLRSLPAKAQAVDLAHVHVSTYGSTFRKYFVSKKLYKIEVPFILHNHGGDYHIFYNRLSIWHRARVREMFRWACGTIVLSAWWEEFHRKVLVPSDYPLWVLPNPIELPSTWATDTVAEETRLLYLGRMDEHKGSNRVLQAIAKLPPEVRSRVRLYMAGDGSVEAMQHLAQQLGIADRIEIRNWIEGGEKETWLQQTHVFILPSRAEGLPMAMLEAMAWGKALIVSPVGGVPEFVEDGHEGLLVPPDDIHAISEAIRRLVESPELRIQMGRAARSRVEPLSIEHYKRRLGQIYAEVMGRIKTGKIEGTST